MGLLARNGDACFVVNGPIEIVPERVSQYNVLR